MTSMHMYDFPVVVKDWDGGGTHLPRELGLFAGAAMHFWCMSWPRRLIRLGSGTNLAMNECTNPC